MDSIRVWAADQAQAKIFHSYLILFWFFFLAKCEKKELNISCGNTLTFEAPLLNAVDGMKHKTKVWDLGINIYYTQGRRSYLISSETIKTILTCSTNPFEWLIYLRLATLNDNNNNNSTGSISGDWNRVRKNDEVKRNRDETTKLSRTDSGVINKGAWRKRGDSHFYSELNWSKTCRKRHRTDLE